MWKFYKPHMYANPSHFLCQLHQGNCQGKTIPGQSGWAIWFTSLDAFGASHMALVVKNTPAKAGDIRDADSICWVGKIPWRSAWQYSYLENPMNRGAWQVTVNGLKKSQTRLKQLGTHDVCFSHLTLLLFSHSVVSHSLQPYGQQHARLPCPSPSPGVCSNLCPLSQWCHPTISSSVIPCFSCLRSFPASGSFPMSQLFPSSCWSIGASASASVLSMSIQDWFPLELTGLISLLSRGISGVFSSTTVQKHQFLGILPSLQTTGKTIALTLQT